WPFAFTAVAKLNRPPRVPRSTIPPSSVQEKAWLYPAAVSLQPTTSPASFTAQPVLVAPLTSPPVRRDRANQGQGDAKPVAAQADDLGRSLSPPDQHGRPRNGHSHE